MYKSAVYWLTQHLLGSKPIPSLLSMPRVKILYLNEQPAYLRGLPFIIAGPLKVVRQIVDIFHTLFVRIPHPPEFILVQVRSQLVKLDMCIELQGPYASKDRTRLVYQHLPLCGSSPN